MKVKRLKKKTKNNKKQTKNGRTVMYSAPFTRTTTGSKTYVLSSVKLKKAIRRKRELSTNPQTVVSTFHVRLSWSFSGCLTSKQHTRVYQVGICYNCTFRHTKSYR